MGRLTPFFTHIATEGRSHFTTDEARAALGVSTQAARAVLRRAKRRGEIAEPQRGFHVLVPLEHRRSGCLPPERFIDPLMAHSGERYHVALLSAAGLLGVEVPRPPAFQVMLAKARRPLDCGDVRVHFTVRRDLDRAATIEQRLPWGPVRVSSAENTMLELVGYAGQCRSLREVAQGAAMLADIADPDKLIETAKACPIAWAQRLGYLLDCEDQGHFTDPLADYVKERAPSVARLVRSQEPKGAERDARWRLIINAKLDDPSKSSSNTDAVSAAGGQAS